MPASAPDTVVVAGFAALMDSPAPVGAEAERSSADGVTAAAFGPDEEVAPAALVPPAAAAAPAPAAGPAAPPASPAPGPGVAVGPEGMGALPPGARDGSSRGAVDGGGPLAGPEGDALPLDGVPRSGVAEGWCGGKRDCARSPSGTDAGRVGVGVLPCAERSLDDGLVGLGPGVDGAVCDPPDGPGAEDRSCGAEPGRSASVPTGGRGAASPGDDVAGSDSRWSFGRSSPARSTSRRKVADEGPGSPVLLEGGSAVTYQV